MRNIITTIVVSGFALASLQSEAQDTRAGSSNQTVSPNTICPEEPLLQNAAATKNTTLAPRLLDPCNGDPGGGDPGGGGTPPPPPPPPPFSPPPMAPPQEFLPGQPAHGLIGAVCNQYPHAFTGFSNDLSRGTTLYLSGIVAPNTVAVYGFFYPSGQLADIEATNLSKSNCVIHHDENPYDTNRLAPGYYSVYAHYIGLGQYGAPHCYFPFGPPPGFNYYVRTSGYQCGITTYVTTIRIR